MAWPGFMAQGSEHEPARPVLMPLRPPSQGSCLSARRRGTQVAGSCGRVVTKVGAFWRLQHIVSRGFEILIPLGASLPTSAFHARCAGAPPPGSPL